MIEFIWLNNREENVNISKFIEKNYIYSVESKDLFNYNKELIFNQMSIDDKIEFEKKFNKYPNDYEDIDENMDLPNPCSIKIKSKNVTAEIAINSTNLQTDTADFFSFADEKIQEIYQDEGFVADSVNKKSLDCQVFGWFKSLYYIGLDYNDKTIKMDKGSLSEYSDLSKHIISLATSVTDNGGSFTMRLPIINAESLGTTFIAKIKDDIKESLGQIGRASKKNSTYEFEKKQYYSKNSFNSLESNYFNWLISSNDILFISFEKLKMELDRNENSVGDEDNFDINTAISKGVYDMIGLVDEVKIVTASASAEAYVEITGRDLMKLLIDDGSFFFNPSTTSDPSKVFQNDRSSGKQGDVRETGFGDKNVNPIDRLRRISGEIDIFANRINMEIGYILKGVISQLANVEIVPGYVFDSWGEERTKFINLQPKKGK